MRRILIVFALGLAACTPPQQRSDGATTSAPEVDPAIAAVVNATLSADTGKEVRARIDTLRIEGDWAWVVALPQAPGGGAFDFSGTRYAEREASGVLDGGGTTYMLLQHQEGVWVVRDFAVGPTDVAYADWPIQYGAPAALMGLPAQ